MENELGLALVEQVNSSSASAPSSPRLRSVEASQDESLSQERTETTASRPDEPRDASRHGTPAQGLEKWEQLETRVAAEPLGRRDLQEEELVGEVGGVEMQPQEDLAGQKEELRRPAVGDQHDEDVEDEDPRPAKRWRLPARQALTPSFDHESEARFGQPHSLSPPSTTPLELDDAQFQADRGCPPPSTDDEHHCAPEVSRSPSAEAASMPAAEYHECSVQGVLKCTRIGSETTYNLVFNLTQVTELNFSVNPKALGICSSRKTSARAAVPHGGATYAKVPAASQPSMKRPPWTPEEDATLVKMRKEDNCSWEEIYDALPSRSPGAIQVRYSTKFNSGASGLRKRQRS